MLLLESPLKAALYSLVVIVVGLVLAGCATVPVNRPCGVIRDDLLTVEAKTPAGQQRLDVHYERGKTAGCW